MIPVQIQITARGGIKMLHSDSVDLAVFGDAHIERASEVEFDNLGKKWFVRSSSTGVIVGRGFCSRSEALDWERDYFSIAGVGWREPKSAARFWKCVDKNGAIQKHRPDLGKCWSIRGYHNANGYGVFYAGGNPMLAHRYSFELIIGPIPDGLEIDHLCRNRGCLRPEHLEPKTRKENACAPGSLAGKNLASVRRAQKFCLRGHIYNNKNTGVYVRILNSGHKGQNRYCRICRREKSARR